MKKILVVEDNGNNLYMIKFILEKNGYNVVQAKNGLEGVNLAKTCQPNLIIMDIQLPVLDGYEATRRIKANISTNHIPIIAVTSYAMSGDRAKTIEAGCDGYIEKPIEPETFIKEIRQFLEA